MTKILLTGASGFVGSTLCEELNRRGGLDVRCLMRKTSSSANLSAAKFTTVQGDLSSVEGLKEAVEGVDIVFHVAGAVAARNWDGFYEANVMGTRNLLDAVARYGKGVKRFVFVSSLAAAGPSRPDRARRESDESAPVSDYGRSKFEAEKEVLSRKDDFPVTIVRPPAVYGPRDRGVFTFFQAIRSGVLPLLGMDRTDPRRYSFVHVDDLVQGLCLAGLRESSATGEVYYVSGDGEYSWPQAMKLMAEGMQKKTIPLRLPLTVMKGAAAACSAYTVAFGKVLPFSLDKIREIEAPAWTCANEKAKKELGFEPYWDLAKGFAQTAKWYKENRWL